MKNFRLLLNQNGVSLVQSLIAVAVTAGAATMGMRVMDNLSTQTKMVEKRSAISSVMNEINTHLQSKAVCASNLNSALLNQPHNGLSNYTSNYLTVSVNEFYGAQGRVVISKNDSFGTQELFEVDDIQIRLNQVAAAADAAYTHSAAGQVRITFKTCRKGLTNCDESKKMTITKIAPLPNVNLIADSTIFTSFDCASGQDGLLEQAGLDSNDKLTRLVNAVNNRYTLMEQDYINKLNNSLEQNCNLKAKQMQSTGTAGDVDPTQCGNMKVTVSTATLIALSETGNNKTKTIPDSMVPGTLVVSLVAGGGGGGGGDRDEPGGGGSAGNILENFSMSSVQPGQSCTFTTGAGGSAGDGAGNATGGGTGGNTQITCGGLYKVVTGGGGGCAECRSGRTGDRGSDRWFRGVKYSGGGGGRRRNDGANGSGYGSGAGGGGDRWGEGGVGGRGAVLVTYTDAVISGTFPQLAGSNFVPIKVCEIIGDCSAPIYEEATPTEEVAVLTNQSTTTTTDETPANNEDLQPIGTIGGSTSGSSGGSSGGCFLAGTEISLFDGGTKNIEDITVDDILMGTTGEPVRVVKLINFTQHGYKYSINGSRYFVTGSHPFKTLEGWKAFEPKMAKLENPDLDIGQLGMDDVIFTENGVEKVNRFDKMKTSQTVYNFEVDGKHEYIADGYQVHNKMAVQESSFATQ